MKTIKQLEEELQKERDRVELLKEMLRQSEQNKETPLSYLFNRMTMKQHAALQMLFRGASNEEIADRLQVGLSTAKGLVRTMCLNSNVKNRASLVVRYKPLFDLMSEAEYRSLTGLRKEWDANFKEDDPANEVLWRKKHEPDDS